MILKYFIFILLFTYSLLAVTCSVDEKIMYSIAEVEKHPKKPVGYQYLISFNNKEDASFAMNIFPYLFLDNRTVDCLDSYTCADVLYTLYNYNIKNLDCGAFQINTKYHNMDRYEDYFDLKKSYKKACTIVEGHIKNKLSWENIAKYHSKTKKYNEAYKQRLFKVLKKNLKKKRQQNN